jgi:hypothetical protein
MENSFQECKANLFSIRKVIDKKFAVDLTNSPNIIQIFYLQAKEYQS